MENNSISRSRLFLEVGHQKLSFYMVCILIVLVSVHSGLLSYDKDENGQWVQPDWVKGVYWLVPLTGSLLAYGFRQQFV